MDLAILVQIARGAEPAYLLLTNAGFLDLYACDFIPADVAIAGGRIAGIALPETDAYQARDVLDLHGSYLAPGLIDGHVHIESSLVSVPEFARAIAPRGTTTIIADPHETASVPAMTGIRHRLAADMSRSPPDLRLQSPGGAA